MQKSFHLFIVFYFGWVCLCAPVTLKAQRIEILDSGRQVSLRGLSIVDDQVFWVSGSKGSVARSWDGGRQIEWMKVSGYEERDFRDIEAFDAQTAVIMAIDSPAIILKTIDGGKAWKKVFEDHRSGMFLDAMVFKNAHYGVVVGDAVDGHFFLAQTKDGGNHWKVISNNKTAIAEEGEVLFAASGTNIILWDKQPVFVTGGIKSHLINGNKKTLLPLLSSKASAGANSISVAEDGRWVIVGGDYMADHLSEGNCVFSDDSGNTFFTPLVNPYGYKSSIVYAGNQTWISCGTSGVDISTDHGIQWKNFSRQSFHVVQKAKIGKKIFLAGKNGMIANLVFP